MAAEIYQVVCRSSGKKYIGVTSKTSDERFQNHLDNARWNRPGALSSAIRKYGKDDFYVQLLLVVSSMDEAFFYERKIIEAYGTLSPGGYNLTPGGDGVPMTEEIRRAISETKKSRPPTEALLAAYSKRKGRKLSPDHIEKVASKARGRPRSDAWKVKMREINKRKIKDKVDRAFLEGGRISAKVAITYVKHFGETRDLSSILMDSHKYKRSRPKPPPSTKTPRPDWRTRENRTPWPAELRAATNVKISNSWTPAMRQAARERRISMNAAKAALREQGGGVA